MGSKASKKPGIDKAKLSDRYATVGDLTNSPTSLSIAPRYGDQRHRTRSSDHSSNWFLAIMDVDTIDSQVLNLLCLQHLEFSGLIFINVDVLMYLIEIIIKFTTVFSGGASMLSPTHLSFRMAR